MKPVRYRRFGPAAGGCRSGGPGPGARSAPELLPQLPKLKLIQLLSAGAEDWIGGAVGRAAVHLPRGARRGTAEWVVAALLSIYRELGQFGADQAARVWNRQSTDTLQGQRVLIIGAGDLGRQLRRRLEPFDTHVSMVGLTAREGVSVWRTCPRCCRSTTWWC